MITMMNTVNKPYVRERFDMDDIRRIRDFNSLRHMNMTAEEIIEDTRAGAAEIIVRLQKMREARDSQKT